MDWSEVSGQTAKAVMLGCQRAFESTQKLLIDRDYSRVLRWRIAKFIKEGLLEPRRTPSPTNGTPSLGRFLIA